MAKKKTRLLSRLTEETQKEILRKNWLSHDAKWQYSVFMNIGVDAGNELNKKVAKEMGKTAMFRLMNALNIKEIKNSNEFFDVLETTMELYWDIPGFDYRIEKVSDDTLLGIVRKCVVNNNVKKAGVQNMYECGCFSMRAGWYDALGLDIKESLGSCLKNGDDECTITIKIN